MSIIPQCLKCITTIRKRKKEAFGRVSAQLRKKWSHKIRGQRNGLHFISTASRAHPTVVLLVVPQRGPHSHLLTPLHSLFIVLGTFSTQSSAQLSQSLYFRVLLSYYPTRIILYTSNCTPSISHSIPLLTCPPTASITTSKEWIISREKSIVGTEQMNDGRNEGGKLQKSVWWNIYPLKSKGPCRSMDATNSSHRGGKIDNKQIRITWKYVSVLML